MVTLALLALATVCFAFGGFYYLRNARHLSALFVQSTSKLPRQLQFLFPVRWYKSEAFIWSMRLGGFLALAVDLFLFGLFVVSLLKIVSATL